MYYVDSSVKVMY